jgi:hypothetical protein
MSDTYFEIWLHDPTGQRLALLDRALDLDYVLAANTLTQWRLTLDADALKPSWIRKDMIISVWRATTGKPLRADFAGFLTRWLFYDDDDGVGYLALTGPSAMAILDRRIIAYTADSTQSSKSDYTDDMLKEIVDENAGSSATDSDRDLSGAGLAIAADVSAGLSTTRAFAWRNVLTTFITLAEAAEQNGTPIYFDVVPIMAADSITFEFRTYTNQRGTDRTYSSDNPVIFGKEWGNLRRPLLEYDHSNEANYIYVGGQSEAADRKIVERSDTARIGASPWNRCERFIQATNEKTTAALQARGDAALEEYRPRIRFQGELLSVPGTLYGTDWAFGDRVTAVYRGVQIDGTADRVRVRLRPDGSEQVVAKMKVEQ